MAAGSFLGNGRPIKANIEFAVKGKSDAKKFIKIEGELAKLGVKFNVIDDEDRRVWQFGDEADGAKVTFEGRA